MLTNNAKGPATARQDLQEDSKKFLNLVIESAILKHDGTWLKLESKLNPEDLRRAYGDPLDLTESEAQKVSEDLALEYLRNKDKLIKEVHSYCLVSYHYKYKSSITEALYSE